MTVLRHSFVYTIALLLQGLVSFILLPIYTIYLSPAEYGIVGVIGSMTNLLSVFYTFYLQSAITRFYYDYENKKQKIKKLFGSSFLFVFIVGVLLSLVFFLIGPFVSPRIIQGVKFFPYIAIGLVIVFCNAIYILYLSVLQTRQESTRFGITNVCYVVLQCFLTIIFLTVFHMKATGVLLAIALTNSILVFYIFLTFLKSITLTLDKKMLKSSLAYSIPSAPHYLLGWSTIWVNKIMLNNMRSTAVVGIYEVGVYVGGITDVVRAALNQAYLPWFFKELKSVKSDSKKIGRFVEYVSLLYCISALVIALFSKEIVTIIASDRYYTAWQVVPLITFSYVLYGYYYFFVSNLLYDKKYTKYIAICVFISALANATCNIILIPRYGMVGSSIATLLAMGFTSILVLLIAKRIAAFKFPWQKMYSYYVLFFAASLFVFVEDNFTVLTSFLIRVLIVSLLGFAIYKTHKTDVIWFSRFVLQFVRGTRKAMVKR